MMLVGDLCSSQDHQSIDMVTEISSWPREELHFSYPFTNATLSNQELMSVKKKGVLKYFSQIFEEEDEKEIQIGLPTDVKHVAHIGWDGPSAAPPSWMDEFRSQNGGYQSAPLDAQNSREDEDLDKAHGTDGRERELLPGVRRQLPKTSRRRVSNSMDSISLMSSESPVGSLTSHRVLKDSKNSGGGGRRRRKEKPSGTDDAPNKSRKKKTTTTKDKDLDAALSKPSGKRGKRRGSAQHGAITSTSGLTALEDE